MFNCHAPGVFARGLSNKIAPGESPLHLIIDKAPLYPGKGVVGLCIDRCISLLDNLSYNFYCAIGIY